MQCIGVELIRVDFFAFNLLDGIDPGVDDLSIENVLFATGYPPTQGTFPHPRQVVADAFAKKPGPAESEKAAVPGLNAARMFRINADEVIAQTQGLLAKNRLN